MRLTVYLATFVVSPRKDTKKGGCVWSLLMVCLKGLVFCFLEMVRVIFFLFFEALSCHIMACAPERERD
jgi:hypothetical protein